jgi:nicotinamide-nucleotide amidase
VDEETMEHTVGSLLSDLGCTLAVAESVTGGLIAARVVSVPGASQWFTGGVVSYASTVKHDLLGLPPGPVVSARAACDMAEGVRRLLGSDFGLATTGVAGPDSQEGRPPGTVFVGLALSSSAQESAELRLPGDRERVRQMAVISALDLLRMRLLARSREGGLQPVEEGLSSSAR